MQHDYIIELLNFQDKDLIIDNIDSKSNPIIITVHKDLSLSNNVCTNCGSTNIKTHAYYKRKIKYLDIGGKHSIIIYNQRRFVCNDCKKTFNESIKLVEKGSGISNSLKIKVLEDTKKKQSFKDISNNNNISDTTVTNLFTKHASDLRNTLTEIICLDEFKASTIAGEYALILGDPISGKILDILPSRKQDYIYYYFSSIKDEERFNVKYIVTDLFESYKSIAETLFHKSIHIADRFHWIRLATEAFNNHRISIMNSYYMLGKDEFKGSFNKYTLYANVLKKNYKLLLANKYSKEQWFFDQKVTASYLQKEMTLQEIIEYCVNNDSDLEEGYFLLQDLYKIAKYSNFENAKKDILEWCEKVEKSEHKLNNFYKVALTYKHWIKHKTTLLCC